MGAAVLQISPFPVPSAPTSGGEIRVAEFAHAYRRAGFEVDRVVVHSRPTRSAQALDVTLSLWDRQRRSHLGRPSGLGHLRQMWTFKRRGTYARELAARLPRTYALIQVEHPWDFDLAWQLRDTPAGAAARIVYSSHNLEAGLQEAVWRGRDHWNAAASRMVAEILAHEADIARRADVCWATSHSDAQGLRDFGARRVVVAPNGVSPLAPFDAAAKVPAPPYLLFVGSSHVPNVTGWKEWLPAPLTDLPTGTRIVLAGSVGQAIARDAAYAADFAAKRLVDAGRLARADLDQLIRHAHGIVLPISAGGGTNLKTAEALAAGRPVIATPMSMRGFESHAQRQGVHMAATPAAFRTAAFDLLRSPRAADVEDAATETFLWQRAFDGVWPTLRELGIDAP